MGKFDSKSAQKKLRVWRKAVMKRGGNKCSKCGKRSKSNHAHHKKQKSLHPSMAYTVSNGTILCKKHHMALHKKIGFGKHSYNEVKSWRKKRRKRRKPVKRTGAIRVKIKSYRKKTYKVKVRRPKRRRR